MGSEMCIRDSGHVVCCFGGLRLPFQGTVASALWLAIVAFCICVVGQSARERDLALPCWLLWRRLRCSCLGFSASSLVFLFVLCSVVVALHCCDMLLRRPSAELDGLALTIAICLFQRHWCVAAARLGHSLLHYPCLTPCWSSAALAALCCSGPSSIIASLPRLRLVDFDPALAVLPPSWRVSMAFVPPPAASRRRGLSVPALES